MKSHPFDSPDLVTLSTTNGRRQARQARASETSERARENGGLKIDSTPLNNPGTQEHWAVAAQTQRWPSKDGEASLACFYWSCWRHWHCCSCWWSRVCHTHKKLRNLYGISSDQAEISRAKPIRAGKVASWANLSLGITIFELKPSWLLCTSIRSMLTTT